MRLKTILLPTLFALLLVLGTPLSAHASSHGHRGATSWQQYDTASYVVSTLNLLQTRSHESMVDRWVRKYGALRFDVYQAAADPSFFVIDVSRSDGGLVQRLQYRMGWERPRPIQPAPRRSERHVSERPVRQAPIAGEQNLIGTFTSTQLTSEGLLTP